MFISMYRLMGGSHCLCSRCNSCRLVVLVPFSLVDHRVHTFDLAPVSYEVPFMMQPSTVCSGLGPAVCGLCVVRVHFCKLVAVVSSLIENHTQAELYQLYAS